LTSSVDIKAVLDGRILDVHLPTIYEISMESVTCRVAVREHELASGRLVD